MTWTVKSLKEFLDDFDCDARVELSGVRSRTRYHFYEAWDSNGKPQISIATEGDSYFQAVENSKNQREQKEREEEYRDAYNNYFQKQIDNGEENYIFEEDLFDAKFDPIGDFIRGLFNETNLRKL